MATPAALLNILLVANTSQANAALAKTQAQLTATSRTATATSATMKKAMGGLVVAAGAAAYGLYKIGEEFDDAYDKIRIGTGATGKELKKLEKSFNSVVEDVPASFEDASTAIADLNSRMGLSGKPLEKMTKQVTELSRITKTDVSGNVESISKAFVDWEVKTKDMGKTLDGFFRISQQSGASVGEMTDAVQKFGSPLRQLGFDLDEAASMWATFVRAGVNTQTMVPGLKYALSNLNAPTDDLRVKMEDLGIAIGKPEKGIQQVFDLLGNESNISQIEKTSLAMEVFGKRAGADMAEAIKQGRFEVDDMLKTFRGGEDTIRKAGRDTMDLSEHWQQFTNILKVRLQPVAEDVFAGLGDLMKDLTKAFKQNGWEGVIDTLLEKLNDALPKIQEVAIKIGGKLAEGLVKGFQSAPILTSLFVGGAMLKMFGGGSAIGSAGKVLGKKFGGGFGLGLVGVGVAAFAQLYSEGKKTLEGHGSKSLSELFEGEFGNIAKAINKATQAKDLHGLLEIQELLDGMRESAINSGEAVPKSLDKLIQATDKARAKMGADLKSVIGKFDDFTDGGGDMADDFDKSVDKLNSDANRLANGMSGAFRKVGKGINSLDKGVGKGLDNIGKNTNSLLKGLKVGEVSYSIKKAGEALQGFQRGGHINLGAPVGDSVPALLERDEYVLNREAVKRIGKDKLDAINFNHAPRFQKGGSVIEQALGPYSIGPIQYDPNHAGGNSHLHLDFFTKAQAITYGKKMQEMGWNISEYSGPYGGFGGLTTSHQSPGHYDGTAFDANTAADETKAEVEAVARLLGSGVSGAMVDKIRRVLLEGPDGPLRRGGQAALDKVRNAANALIKKKAASSVGGGVNAAMYNGPLDRNFGAGDNTQIPFNAAAMLAEKAGLPGITYAQIAIGESNLTPGAVSPDGGYGLWQMTPRVQSASTVAAWEKVGTYFNPWNNAQQAKILAGGGTGVGNYYGIGSVTDWNKHYTGPMKFQRGGLVQRLAKGGQPKFTGSMTTWNPDASGAKLGEPFKTAESMRAVLDRIGLIDERIGMADALANRDGLFSAAERRHAIQLNTDLLRSLIEGRDFARFGIDKSTQMLARSSTPDWQKKLIREVMPSFTETLLDTQGLTGKGGRIFDTLVTLAKLKSTAPDAAAGPDYLGAIESQIALAGLTPELTDDIAGYTALVSFWEQALSGLQASGGSFSDISNAASSLKSARDTLADLLGTGSSTTAPDTSELDALKLAQAMATISRLNVGIAQNSVFAGTFAKGGSIPAGQWGIAGERGPEIVHGPAQVHSNRDSQAMLKPEVRVVLEDNRTVVTVDGQVEAIVDNKLNQIARSRSYAGAGRI